MYRLFEKTLEEWDKNKTKPLVVLGVRQCGKTYIIKKYFSNKYKKFVYISLFEDERLIDICTKEKVYLKRKALFCSTYGIDFEDKDTLVFVDEAQKCPLFIQDLKAYCEEGINNIVIAGSLLSNKLKEMNESYPVGKTRTKYLYPMNFEEYLYAIKKEGYIPLIKECFLKNEPFALHDSLMKIYYDYLYLGGMPEVIQNYIDNSFDISKIDSDIMDDIYNGYSSDITKHVFSEKEKLRIQRIYQNVHTQLMKENPKFTYSGLEGNDKKKDYTYALDWLATSNMVLECNQLTIPKYPINAYKDEDNYKLFLSDVGLLRYTMKSNVFDVLVSENYPAKGILTENYVATEIKMQFGELNYWTRKNAGNGSKAEVDFVIEVNGKVIPVEVKSGNNKSQSLRIYNELFNPELTIKIANSNFGQVNNIKTIPLYATFLLKECLEEICK